MKTVLPSIKMKFLFLVISFMTICAFTNAQIVNSGFETGTLAGWTSSAGSATIANGGVYSVGGQNWTVNPAGAHMAQVVPTSNLLKSTAESNLGLAPGAFLAFNSNFGNATNFGTLTQDVLLNAGQSITMYWNYVAGDYTPFDDGVFATFTGPTVKSLKILSAVGMNFGDPNAM
ncbi:MAG: hypothetical protein NVS3B19_17540 [Ginsengibacter sp.]